MGSEFLSLIIFLKKIQIFGTKIEIVAHGGEINLREFILYTPVEEVTNSYLGKFSLSPYLEELKTLTPNIDR